ncbi:MAG TPA: glycosyltransferase, partial [Vicinamibacteria bacterium]|nr:glycosyltransferase [Vicinamibacteria bacterium]
MAPLRILHYTPAYGSAPGFGGPPLSVSRLCEALARLGHQVSVHTSSAGRPQAEQDRDLLRQEKGVAVHYFARRAGMGINSPGMEEAVRRDAGGFDLVHVTGVWQRTSFAACRAARAAGLPYVVSPRGALAPYTWTQKTLKKAAYFAWRELRNLRGAAGLHYTTAQEQRECRWMRLPGRAAVIPNGFDPTAWPIDGEAARRWRRQHGLSEGPLLLSVGRLHHKKGLELLPHALARVAARPWMIAFVGADEDGTGRRLAEAFARCGLGERVRLLPECPARELPAAYAASSLFVLPSRNESFGNVVVEALLCGCPVLISDRVGLHREVAQA